MPGEPTFEDKGDKRVDTMRVVPASQAALYQVQTVVFEGTPVDPTHVLEQLLRSPSKGWKRLSRRDCVAIDCSQFDEGLYRVAFFFGHALCVLMVVPMTPSVYRSEDTQRFFDSFRVVPAPTRVKIMGLSVDVPAGWSLERRDATVAFKSPGRFSVGPVQKADQFTVTVLRASVQNAMEFARKALGNEQSESQLIERANEGAGKVVAFDSSDLRAIEVGGVAAAVSEGPSAIEVYGHRFEYVGPRVFLLAGNLGYVVAARFNRERAADAGPIATAFVASLRVESV